MKQIRLKDDIFVIKYCGGCPFQHYHNIYGKCGLGIDMQDSFINCPDGCPLEEYQEESK